MTIRQYLPIFLRSIKPEKSHFQQFQNALMELFAETNKASSQGEEYEKGVLKEFVRELFPNKKINTFKSGNWANVDLCVYNNDGDPEIIFESKAVENSLEMLDSTSANGLNKKALHETILYYFDIKLSQRKNSVKTIVITNNIEWFVIDSVAFDSLTVQNSQVRKIFQNFDEQRNGSRKPRSSDFYSLLKRYFDSHPQVLEAFSEKCLAFKLTKLDISDDHKCVWYYRLFSPDSLLKKRHDVAYALDKGFYSELLYIIGLKETTETKTIVRLDESERQENSIIEQVIEQLKDKGIREDNVFELALELSITWLNRILFIKLLEAQLINWHPNNSAEYKILTKTLVNGYDWLNALFFSVLAKPLEDRSKRVEKFFNVPYLNSSLFEETEAENRFGIKVSSLIDGPIKLFTKTVLKNEHGRPYAKNIQIDALEYLFRFLDSYDFGLEDEELFLTHGKTLISPSVLGLIFEKINGYKDGSYFTPSHVTFYMARSTITRAVIDKLSFHFHQTFNSLVDVSNFIGLDRDKKEEVKQVLDHILVCDPAAGSGHFLVSALNVLFDINYQLKLIYTDNGELINNFVNIEIDEDETLISDESGKPYVYVPTNHHSQLIQKAIFETKKSIIENSLFGVDINEKSVQICRLRLWIELLKYAYYTNSKNSEILQTMPNIDINIKKGNSLVNRYEIVLGQPAKSLPSDLNDARKLIKEYRQAVKAYRNDANKLNKQRLNKTIVDIKTLLGVNRQLAFDFGIEFGFKKDDQDPVLKQSFEWMLEFPEALDDNGKFLGFDSVLVNPPYIDSEAMKKHLQREREYYREKFSVTKGNWDIYIPFIERCFQLLGKNGHCSCITPDKWLSKDFGMALREFLAPKVRSISRFGRDVFENALVDAIVTEFSHKKSSNCVFGEYDKGSVIELNKVKNSALTSTYDYHFNKSQTLDIGENLSLRISSLAKCEGACATSDCYLLADILRDGDPQIEDSQVESYRLVNTGTLSKFNSLWGKKPITYLKRKLLYPIVEKGEFEKIFGGKAYDVKTKSSKIIIKGLTKLDGMLDINGEYIPGKSTVVVLSKDVPLLKILLAIINSSFAIEYLKRRFPSATYNGGITFNGDIIGAIPIPNLDDNQKEKIISSVDEILTKGIGVNEERWIALDQYISSLYRWNKEMN